MPFISLNLLTKRLPLLKPTLSKDFKFAVALRRSYAFIFTQPNALKKSTVTATPNYPLVLQLR